MPRFAANLGYLFTDRPLIERIDAAAACGFKAIELQFPYDAAASDVRAAIERNCLTILGINTAPASLVLRQYRAAKGTSISFFNKHSITLPRSAAARFTVSPAMSARNSGPPRSASSSRTWRVPPSARQRSRSSC